MTPDLRQPRLDGKVNVPSEAAGQLDETVRVVYLMPCLGRPLRIKKGSDKSLKGVNKLMFKWIKKEVLL